MPFRHATRRMLMLLVVVLLIAASDAARASITGVCPDGSIFIVQHASAIPCSAHKRVEPEDVPPIKPEYLPRPYAWEVFNRQQDPNNPYNLIDEARKVREAGQAGAAGRDDARDEARTSPRVERAQSPAPPVAEAPTRTAMVDPQIAPPDPSPDLGLSDQEVQNLFLIVHLAQRRAPATFEAEVGRAVTVRLAQSSSFVPRLRNARRDLPNGPVLLFAAVADETSAFHANLTFVQGHEAFQPDRADPDQLGVIRGRLGTLEADEGVIGYVVLPERMDTQKPIEIYWNDRQLTATLQP